VSRCRALWRDALAAGAACEVPFIAIPAPDLSDNTFTGPTLYVCCYTFGCALCMFQVAQWNMARVSCYREVALRRSRPYHCNHDAYVRLDRYTTGLGLPLSRALAKAANGWLGLDDTCVLSSPPGSISSGSSAPAPVQVVGSRRAPDDRAGDDSHAVHIITHYWCVVEASDSVSRAYCVHATFCQ
jgi:hypothetical protein